MSDQKTDIYEKYAYIRQFYKGQFFLINFNKISGTRKLRLDYVVSRFVDIATDITFGIRSNC